MNFREIINATKRGKYVVWVDDKQKSELTPEYMEQHFVALVDSVDDGYQLCSRLHEGERKVHGRAITRYRISSGKEDYVLSEDLSAEDMARIAENIPMADDD